MRRSVFWLLDHYPELGESLARLHQHTLEQAELADRLGFHSLWLAEHHFRRLGTAANPAVLLAAIAQRTQSLRLGPAVSVLPLRNPIQVAEDYALVDSLSGGRLNMGVGAGSEAIEFAGMGCDYEQRKEQFEEHLAVLVDQWRAATAKSSTETCAGAELGEINVAPVQTPCPPIYVATMQEESAYDIGRRGYSLLTLVSPFANHLEDLAARLDAHRRGLRHGAHAEDSAESVVMVFTHVGPTPEASQEVAAPAVARLLETMTGSPLADPLDFYEQACDNTALLCGTSELVEQRIEQFVDLGVGQLAFVTRFGAMPVEAARASLERLAPSS